MIQEAIISVLSLGLTGVSAWAVQLGNRVSVLEAQKEDLKELLNTRFDAVDSRLSRIERKIWNGNGDSH